MRLREGQHWTDEIPIEGTDVALAFAPQGPLYAATSTGLWKLTADRFENVRPESFYQPAISIDQEGQPHVAWNKKGRIVVDDNELDEGEQPTLIFPRKGTATIAYVSKGGIAIREFRSGNWSAAEIMPANKPSWPSLALDANDALRLSYLGPADHGPDGTWLIRIPDKRPVMLPSLEGNITDSWLTTTFNLNQARNHFRRHDLLLTVNDSWFKYFRNTVPEGRYFFRLNPNEVFTSPGQPVRNRIAIHSWHMNPGHYSSNTIYQLGVRMSWSEHYVFAENEEEAKKSVTSEHVNHDQPDLGLFANAADLPIEMPNPGRINIPILIAN